MERRHATEFEAASSFVGLPGRSGVLLLGNSLLLEGIDLQALRAGLPSSVVVQRFALENTAILNWQFGIRRLIAEGSRPRYVILALGVPNLKPDSIRSDYFVFYQLKAADLPELASLLHYDHTQAADLYFARFSLLYAGRNTIRNFALNLVAPSYVDLLHNLALSNDARQTPLQANESAIFNSIDDMRRSCATIGATFMLLIMPGFAETDAPTAMAAARRAGVDVIEPAAEGSFPRMLFRDGFHLNEDGARQFTSLVIPEIASRAAWQFGPAAVTGSQRP
jgi:hypothetical protein